LVELARLVLSDFNIGRCLVAFFSRNHHNLNALRGIWYGIGSATGSGSAVGWSDPLTSVERVVIVERPGITATSAVSDVVVLGSRSGDGRS
jgi:hypothetical protein